MKNIVFIVCGLLAAAQGRTVERNALYKPRVVYGKEAQLGERPYQVSMQIDNTHWCGGSILNEYWVVTAAHCAYGRTARIVKIVAGTVDLREAYSLHQAEEVIVHGGYNRADSFRNDIALIKVATPFEFSFRIQPVVLPQAHTTLKINSSVVVSGWGQTTDGTYPMRLQKAQVFITDPDYCSAVVKERNENVYPTNICAHNPTSRRGECFGDSGGPVTVGGVLVGIVSWSIKDPDCGSPHYPGVHTRVSEYIDWIRSYTDIAAFVFCGLLLAVVQGQANEKETDHQSKIVNGEDAELGEGPYQIFEDLTSNTKLFNELFHENYTPRNYQWNDIALMKVASPFDFSSNRIKPVRLPHHCSVVVPGRGKDEHHQLTVMLNTALVYIVGQEACRTAVRSEGQNIYRADICANDPCETKEDCHGDFDDPLTVEAILAGIVSWAVDKSTCGSPYYPRVFTRVSYYVNWINVHIN